MSSSINYREVGYINTNGQLVIPFSEGLPPGLPYETFPQLEFSEGLAVVEVGEATYGYMNKTGTLISSVGFSVAEPFSDGVALVKEKVSGESYFIDKAGRKAIVFPRGVTPISSFSEGFARVEAVVGGILKQGFANNTGTVVIEPKFDQAGDFVSGFAAVNLHGRWGFINSAGVFVVSPGYDSVADLANGFSRIELGGKWGFVNSAGEIFVTPRYDEIGEYSEDGFAPVREGDRWGFVDDTGDLVVPPKYKWVGTFFSGLAAVQLGNGKLGFINGAGGLVIRTNYPVPSESNLAFEIIGRWGMQCMLELDSPSKSTRWRSRQTDFESEESYVPLFSEGLAPVRIQGKWGYINMKGSLTIPPVFDAASDFIEGVARVRVGRQYGFINHRGQFELGKYAYAGEFRNGLALVFFSWSSMTSEAECSSIDHIEYGYISRSGRTLFRGKYVFKEFFDIPGGAIYGDTDAPKPVDLKIESVPAGAEIYLVPWFRWKREGEKSLTTCLECKQPVPTDAVRKVQQQKYMVVLKRERSMWSSIVDVTEVTRNEVRWVTRP